ncbi:MAG: hypothetical protein M3Y84_00640 [Acidobacteriota bacterium]|nr:hypothetical protein [Acidobacteriota bacterium]
MESTIAITGASGSIYAQRTLVQMAASEEVECINHRPQTIESLIDHFVFRILDHLSVPQSQDTLERPEGKSGELIGARED